jgi:hypothetical protein
MRDPDVIDVTSVIEKLLNLDMIASLGPEPLCISRG